MKKFKDKILKNLDDTYIRWGMIFGLLVVVVVKEPPFIMKFIGLTVSFLLIFYPTIRQKKWKEKLIGIPRWGIALFLGFYFLSYLGEGNSDKKMYCDCYKELETMRNRSKLYQSCISHFNIISLPNGPYPNNNDPFNLFKDICEGNVKLLKYNKKSKSWE